MRVSRTRSAAAVALAASLLVGAAAPAAAAPDRTQPLRDLAARHDLGIGTAVDMNAFANDPTYRAEIAEEFNSVTAENVMKWSELEPTRGTYDWAAADRLVRFARRNGQTVRGHVLVWHNQNPQWLVEGVESGEIDSAELRQILRRHIFTVMRHFKGEIWQWDVANEVIDDSGQLRDSFWLRELGPGYIADAFRWAHQADPSAKLFVNDYNVEDVNTKSTAYYHLVRYLLRRGVPIHGFGAQGHHTSSYAPTSMLENLRRFAALGLDVAVTEVDVRIPLPADSTELLAQAQVYSSMLEDCLAVRRCISFTVWGFTDRYSWVPGWFEGEGAANIMDESYDPKPAFRALQTDLASRPYWRSRG